MATTTQTFTGDGVQTSYTIAFPYRTTADVKATIDAVATTSFTVTGSTVTFTTAPANGSTIVLFRETNNATIEADFQSGSALRAVDLNDNFTQLLFVTQESTNTSDTASTDASNAVTTANTASADATTAVNTANTADANATTALNTANTADTNASTALSTANTALSNSTTAISTANTADTNATAAVNTANTADTNASAAVSTANTADTNATAAVNTANNASATATAAQNAVASAVLYDPVGNVASIPSSPSDGDYIEVNDSTGIESFSPLSGLPAGFVGDSGLVVRLRYTTTPSTTWTWQNYFASDSETRYLKDDAAQIVDADINPAANIDLTKLATGALPSAITVETSNIVDGTIVNADISGSAAISLGKLANGALPTGITVDTTNIANGSITDGDISNTASIAVNKLANASPNQLLQTDPTGSFVEFSSNIDIPGTLDVTAAATFDSGVTVTGLLSAEGNATFAGNIDVNGGINGAGSSLFADGRIYGKTVYAQGGVGNGILFQGLGSSANEVFTLATDGSAEFAGDLTIDVDTNAFGKINFKNTQTSSSGYWAIAGDADGDLKYERRNADGSFASAPFIVSNTGSATFAGVLQGNQRVVINGAGGKTGSQDTLLNYAGDGSTVTASFTADGSAYFAGKIDSNEYAAYKQTTSTGDNLIRAFSDVGGTTALKFAVLADGSASFAARGDFGSSAHTTTHALQAQNNKSDRATVLAIQHNTSGPVFEGRNGAVSTTSATSTINADGSATFADVVTGFRFINATNSADPWLKGQNASGVETFFVKKDGSAKFAGNAQLTNPRSSTAGSDTGGLCINPSDSTIYYNFRVDGVDNQLRIDTVQGADKIKFSYDGSATFNDIVYGGAYHITDSKFTAETDELIRILKSGERRFVVKQDGSAYFASNVGIGSTAPLTTLECRGQFSVSNNSNSYWVLDRDDSDGRLKLLDSSTSTNEKLAIDTAGRLLVGTPSAPNDSTFVVKSVYGTNQPANIYLTSYDQSPSSTASLGRIRFSDSGQTTAAQVECSRDGGSWTSGISQPTKLVFSTTADGASSPAMRFTINSDGGLYGFGRSTLSSTTPGDAGGLSIVRQGTLTGTNQPSQVRFMGGSTGTITCVAFYRNTTVVGSITRSNTSTAYNTSSDYRLKENVVDIADGITRVKQLQPKRFNFIADADTTVDGFLAHEAQAVVPEAVTGAHNEVDDDGNPVYQGIDQAKLVPLLTAALQEAIAKIETLEQRLSDAGIA